MNYLKPTISILSIIILAIIIIQLTTPHSRQLAPLLENTATTSLMAVNTVTVTATVTLTATTTPSLTPTPTDTMPPYTPAPTLDRRGSGGRINRGTPTPPTATPTPTHTPIPAVRVVSDEPLFSDELLALIEVSGAAKVYLVEWIDAETAILGVGYPPTYWHISLSQQQIEPTTWEYPKSPPEAVAEMKQYDERAYYVIVSPDGQWGVWGGLNDTLLIKQLNTDAPPLNLVAQLDGYEVLDSSGQIVWSPQSNHLAYIIKNHWDYQHEIRITDIFGNLLVVIPLKSSDHHAYNLAWSPNGRYLVFDMQEQPQSEITNLYLVRVDGTGMMRLTEHGYVDGYIRWHPTGKAISYKHRHKRYPQLISISDW